MREESNRLLIPITKKSAWTTPHALSYLIC
nr:MAG TPA: hypothetical protein [Caudoviricetes sp.]